MFAISENVDKSTLSEDAFSLIRLFQLLLLSLVILLSSCTQSKLGCDDRWKITGFYTPIESDFSNPNKSTIKLKSGTRQAFSADFLKAVRIEGWGRTRFGWYLGYYSKQWHRSNKPLNAKGRPLLIGVVAVDNRVVAKGTQLSIPSLKSSFGFDQFVADDVGSGIKNRHIDVYTGEGKAAKEMTYKITGQQKVCLVVTEKKAPVVDLT